MPGYVTDMMYFPQLKAAGHCGQVNSSAPRATGGPLSRFLKEFAGVIAGSPAAASSQAEQLSVLRADDEPPRGNRRR
jgi:hypothetical protein